MTARFRSKRASSLPHDSGPVPAKLAWGWPFFFGVPFEPASTEFPKRGRGAAALRAPLPRPSSARVRGGPEGDVPQQAREVPHAPVSRHRSPKGSHPMNATEIAAALSARAEDVCRRYLPRGRRQGRYWTSATQAAPRGARSSCAWRLQAYPENGPNMLRCWLCCVFAIGCIPTDDRRLLSNITSAHSS